MVASVPHVFATTPATPAPPASQLDDNFNALIAAINAIVVPTASTPRAYLAGMTLSNDSGTPNSILDIAPGQATDSTNAFTINLPTTITKSTGALWLAGNGNGGMGNGLTIAAATWYHVFAIINGGLVDCYFDTSFTAANKPSNTTAFRRVGSILTDGSKNIIAFIQDGDLFQWKAPVANVSATNPGTAAVTASLTVAPGASVQAIVEMIVSNTGSAAEVYGYISDLATTDTAAAITLTDTSTALSAVGGAKAGASRFNVRTNASGQIRTRLGFSDGTTILTINAIGWFDSRGRNA